MKILLLLLSLSMLAATHGCAYGRDAAQAVATMTTPEGDVYCAGVAIKPQVVLTAEHCLHEGMLANGKPVIAVLALDGNDHALIKTQHVYEHTVKVASSARDHRLPSTGTAVEAYGHPAGFPVQYRRGYVTGNMIPAPFILEHILTGEATMFDLEGMGGDSGGPVLRHGKVVATISIAFQAGAFSLMGAFPFLFTPAQWDAE